MSQFAYVVLSNPVPGREEDYNDWYTNRHLGEVAAVPGFVSARRFRLADSAAEGAPKQRYMAIYMMDTSDPEEAVKRLADMVESGTMEMSEAFSMDDMAAHLYEAITPVIATAKKDA